MSSSHSKKNIHPFSERLLRFIHSRSPSKSAFAEDVGLTPQALNQTYLRSDPFPGSLFLHKCAVLGCDLNWLITGYGLSPDPTAAEMEWWIRYCESQILKWKGEMETHASFLTEQKSIYETHAAPPSRKGGKK